MDLLYEVDLGPGGWSWAGGTLRKLTRSFVGPLAVRAIESHFADHVIFSVRGVTADGLLSDPDPLEAEVKRRDDRAAHGRRSCSSTRRRSTAPHSPRSATSAR